MLEEASNDLKSQYGGVAEWSIATVLKTVVRESVPWVRIPPPPPNCLQITWMEFIIDFEGDEKLVGEFSGFAEFHYLDAETRELNDDCPEPTLFHPIPVSLKTSIANDCTTHCPLIPR